jgi:hypothetical protein
MTIRRIALAQHGHFAGRSKNIHLRWIFISEFIRDGILKLHQVRTTNWQVADIGKDLPWPLFCALLKDVPWSLFCALLTSSMD